jgi:hypothetical protein
VSELITSRHDRNWSPISLDGEEYDVALMPSRQIRHLCPGDVFQLQRSRGFSRHSPDWRPGLGELSTAEIVARKLGIPGPYIDPRRRGSLGQSTQQISAIAATGANTTVSILKQLGDISGPVGTAITGIITIAQLLVGIFKGCGQTCVEATSIANQVATVLTQNVQNYVNSPVRTQSMQDAAINNFQTAWSALVANCNNPQLGSAGQNCISQRQQGACAYKTSPGGWTQNSDGSCSYTWAGANGSGSTCWNWFVGFLDPIQNDPCVQSDSAATSSTTSATGTGTTETAIAGTTPDYAPLLLIGAGILLAWAVL